MTQQHNSDAATVTLTQQQLQELQEGRGSLRGTISVTRADSGRVDTYQIELRPLPQGKESPHG